MGNRLIEVPPMKRLLDVLREDLAPHRHERRLRRRRVRSLRHPLQRRASQLLPDPRPPSQQRHPHHHRRPRPANDAPILYPLSPIPCLTPHPAMFPGARRSPMRHLHSRHDPRHPPSAHPTPPPHRRPNPRRPRRQPLPLHRLHAYLRVRKASRLNSTPNPLISVILRETEDLLLPLHLPLLFFLYSLWESASPFLPLSWLVFAVIPTLERSKGKALCIRRCRRVAPVLPSPHPKAGAQRSNLG